MYKYLKGTIILFLVLCVIPLVQAYPSITINSPESRAYNTSSIEFNVTINETGLCWYSLDYGLNNISMDTLDNLTFNYTNSSMIEGNYTIIFFCNDSLGEVNETNISLTIDTTFPSINIISPTNTTYNNATQLVNISVSEINTDRIWFFNGTENETYTTETNIIFSEGNNTLHVWVNDTAGNLNYTNVTFEIDTIPPNITINSPTNTTYNTTTILIDITSDGTTWFFNGTENETYVAPINKTYAEGIHTLHVWSTDTIGNLNYTNVTFEVLINTASTVNLNQPENNTNTTQTSVLLNVTVFDDDLDNLTVYFYGDDAIINITEYQVNGTDVTYNWTGLSEGIHNWTIMLDDGVINTSSEYRYFTVDATPPAIVFNPDTTNDTTSSQTYIIINVTATDYNLALLMLYIYNTSGDIINSTVSTSSEGYVNYTVPSDGIYYFNATATDWLGNENSTETRNITIDTTIPAIAYESDTDNSLYINRDYILVNVTVSNLNVTNLTISLYNSSMMLVTESSTNLTNLFANFTGLIEGTYYFNATATDGVTNLSTNTRNITIDLINPEIAFASNTDNVELINRNYIIINITVTDTNLDYAKISIYNDTDLVYNTTTVNETLNYTVPVDGIYYYNATAYDSAGNYNYTETRNITIDTTPPIITTYSPTNTAYNNATQLINITATDTYIDSIWFFNGTENETYINETYRTFVEGNNTIIIYANDTSGNINSTSITFVIDTITPSITIISPTNTSYNTSNIELNYTTDDVNLDSVWYEYNNTNNTLSGNTTFTAIEGTSTIIIYINDTAGNTNQTSISFNVDTLGPIITFNSPASSGLTITTTSVSFNISATDSHFANMTLYLYNSSGSLRNNITINTTSLTTTISSLSNGIYYYNVTAYDTLGYTTTSTVRNITINYTAPASPPSSSGSRTTSSSSSGSDYTYIPTADNVTTDVVTFNQFYPTLSEGNRTTNLDMNGMPIIYYSIYINTAAELSNTLKITSQPTNPTNISANASIYKYIIINTTIAPYIEVFNFKFKIKKEWISQNNLTKDNITIYSYDNEWTNIGASQYSEDTGYVYYSSNISGIKNFAIGGPLIPKIEAIKEEIVQEEAVTLETIPESTIIQTDASNKGFLKSVGAFFTNAKNNAYIFIVNLDSDMKKLIVLTISSILMLIIGVVSGVLLYRTVLKSKKIRWSNRNIFGSKKTITGRIMPYTEEPPLSQPSPIPSTINVKVAEMPKEVSVNPDPEFNVRKVNELIMQCEYALDNGRVDEAKKYYDEARVIYFNSGLDYEQKSRLYNKIINLHNRLSK